jgi:sugar lactone lactonase YvrE
VPLPPKLAANSVAAFSDGTLVATVLILPGKTFEDAFAGRNTGIVLQWTPGTPAFIELKGTELVANNGIETSPDDREFYVASTPTRRIYAFSRVKPGAGPLRFAQLKDFGPDNVRWTADNRLITAGLIDDEPACGGRPKDEKGIRCPMGYAVATIDPTTMTATEIARGPRTPSFTGTAMAAVIDHELWLGSFLADRLAYRSLK